MDKITVGVLTVSDSCDSGEAVDESGPNLVSMIERGIIKNAKVVETALVPDKKSSIEAILNSWCDDMINVILTTGGTGLSDTDTTPEATLALSGKLVPGISHLILKRGLDLTPFAALSRAVTCVVGKSLIINLPGSTKAAQQCLEATADVIPHAVDLITGRQKVVKQVHASVGTKKSSVVVGDVVNRKRESPYEPISVTRAQSIILDRINFLKRTKVVDWENAHNYVLAEDVTATDYLPACDVSLLDGYAVLSSDNEKVKEVSVISIAGDVLSDEKILPGYCARVNTGAAIPPGADAVIGVEDTVLDTVSEDKKEENKITLKKIPEKGAGIRVKGMDHALGQRILSSGTYLDSSAVGLLAAAGVTSVRVFAKPLVAVLSTGNELLEPYEKLTPGKVRDSNRITLISLLKDDGFNALDLGICVDDPNTIRDSLEKGFQTADVVVTSGGMSMGERDYLKEILIHDFNADICFGGVWMKPGKPTSFAVLMFEGKPKLWFGLPGNPASAYVTSHLFILPALRRISGMRAVFPAMVKTTIGEVVPPEARPQYVRGVISYNELTNKWHAKLTGNQMSSRIGSCVNANCLVLIQAKDTEQKPETSNEIKEGFKMPSEQPPSFGSSVFNMSSTGCPPKPLFGTPSSAVKTNVVSPFSTTSTDYSTTLGSSTSSAVSSTGCPYKFSFGASPTSSAVNAKVSSGSSPVPFATPEFKALLIGKVYFPVNDRLEN